jgi:CYTH domain-containing protein
MALEIERKFLVKDDSYKQQAYSSSRIAQGYICSGRGRTVRVRIRDEKAYLTIKGPADIKGLGRYEWEKEIPLEEAKEKLNKALAIGNLTKRRFLIGSLIATVSYAAFFGGDWKAVLVTFFATFLIVLCQFANSYLGGNRILANVTCCLVAGLAATTLCFWTGASLDMVMAGCIMVLIPGISMTSAVENLILGDTLSGWLGLMEAMMTAFALV